MNQHVPGIGTPLRAAVCGMCRWRADFPAFPSHRPGATQEPTWPAPTTMQSVHTVYYTFIEALIRWSILIELGAVVLVTPEIWRRPVSALTRNTILSLIVIVVSIGCLWGVRRRRGRLPIRVYLAVHLVYLTYALLVAPPALVTIAVLFLAVTVLTASFLETPRTGLMWGMVGFTGYLLAHGGRSLIAPVDMGRSGPLLELLLPPAILALFALLGYLATRTVNEALTASAHDRQAMKQAYAEIEQRVAARTQELQETTAQLALAKAAAEEASRLKSEFLASVSHELRTPLNTILNFTHVLGEPRHGPLTPRQTFLQQRVLSNAQHLLALINNILDLSKIEAGQMDLSLGEVDLAALLADVVDTAQGLMSGQPIVLETSVPNGPVPLLIADATRLRQILLNLVSNAVKFTEQGTITLQLESDTTSVTLSVTDTGIGIDAADHARIFAAFQQVEGDLTRRYAGTGMGLAITKRLVELHGGRISLRSTVGHGTTVTVTLPRLGELTPAGDAADAPAIVIVDDDFDMQIILREYLVSAGYRCYSVHDSRSAYAQVLALQPAAVILDVQMPHLDGWGVLARLRADATTARIPIAMCSVADEPRAGTGNPQPDTYFVKPISDASLLHVIHQLVHGATASAQPQPVVPAST